MSFNAGAIEASLTLSRSQWLKDLRTTRKEIAELERKSITIGIDADATNAEIVMDNIEMLANDLDNSTYAFTVDANTGEATSKLEILEEKADSLDRKVIGIEADADTTNATIQLSVLEDYADALDRDPINIKVNVDALDAESELLEIAVLANNLDNSEISLDVDVEDYETANAKLLTLEGQVAALDGRDIDIDVDVDKDNLEALVGSASGAGGGGGGGYLGLLRILIYALIALSPVLSVALSAATAAIIAFTAAVTAAAAAAGILAVGLFGLITLFKETDPSDYTPGMQMFADSIEAVSDAWADFQGAIANGPGFALMADALNILAGILPDLVPLFNEVAGAMRGVLAGLSDWIDSPQYQEMLDFFGGFGVDMLVQFLDIGGNLLVFFGELFAAIEPFAREMMQGLEDLTQGWADWASELDDNRAFQDFMENASTYGPMVLDMLGSLLAAFMSIGQALEPFAGPMLEGLTFFFDLIANADTENLTIIIGLLAGLWAGANILWPILTMVAGGITAISTAIGIGLVPLGLIVGAIAGVVIAFQQLWQEGGVMRDQIMDAWTTMQNTVKPIVEDIRNAIVNNIEPLRAWWSEIWESIRGIVESVMVIISQLVEYNLNLISVLWSGWGQNLIGIAEGALQVVGGVIRAGFAVVETIFKLIKAAVTGDWSSMWGILKNGASDFWAGITSAWNGMTKIVENIWDSITAGPVRAWNAIFGEGGKLRSQWTTFKGWIDERWDSLIQGFAGLAGRVTTAATGMWDGIADSFKDVINRIIGWWNNLSFSVDIPDKIPGLPDAFTITTPDVPTLGTGGYITNPLLAVVGEAGPEIVAPEPVLTRIVQENSGGKFDAKALAAAITAALTPILHKMNISLDRLVDIIEHEGLGVSIDARQYNDGKDAAAELVNQIAVQLRLLGYGGKVTAA